jgi:hypothetical protein
MGWTLFSPYFLLHLCCTYAAPMLHTCCVYAASMLQKCCTYAAQHKRKKGDPKIAFFIL